MDARNRTAKDVWTAQRMLRAFATRLLDYPDFQVYLGQEREGNAKLPSPRPDYMMLVMAARRYCEPKLVGKLIPKADKDKYEFFWFTLAQAICDPEGELLPWDLIPSNSRWLQESPDEYGQRVAPSPKAFIQDPERDGELLFQWTIEGTTQESISVGIEPRQIQSIFSSLREFFLNPQSPTPIMPRQLTPEEREVARKLELSDDEYIRGIFL